MKVDMSAGGATGCDLLAQCGFFSKYRETRDAACKGYISRYCHGTLMDDCMRKNYRLETGYSPPDDMMPNGSFMAFPKPS